MHKGKETGVGIKAATPAAGDHGMSYSSRYFVGHVMRFAVAIQSGIDLLQLCLLIISSLSAAAGQSVLFFLKKKAHPQSSLRLKKDVYHDYLVN